MMKLLSLTCLLLGLTLTSAVAAGDGAVTPGGGGGILTDLSNMPDLSDLMNDLQTALDSFDPVAACNAVCANMCDVQDRQCINIPGLNDCEANKVQCASSCNTLCACVSGCQSDCVGEDYSTKTGLERLTCSAKETACINVCEARCPVAQTVQQAHDNLQGLMFKIAMAVDNLMSVCDGRRRVTPTPPV